MKLLILTLILFASTVWGHARFSLTGTTPPRNNSTGLKTGPCGGLPRTASPVVLQAGATLQLQWEEVVDHPGRFEFYFSAANDEQFQLLKTVADTQNSGALPHTYTATITVPTTNCTACTLQMIQVMTENPASPRNYYSCADIQIQGGAPAPTPTPTPVGPTPTPTPTPAATPIDTTPDDCH